MIDRTPDALDGSPITIGVHVRLQDVARLQDVTGRIRDIPALRGSCLAGTDPIIIFKLASSQRTPDEVFHKIGFIAWGWDLSTGGALTITAFAPGRGQLARVHLDAEDSAFESLRQGRFTALFTSSSRPLHAVRVDFSDTATIEQAYAENWARVRDHVGVIEDRDVRFWEALGCVNYFDGLTPLERLRIGWATALGNKLSRLDQLLQTAANGPAIMLPDSVPPLSAELLRLLTSSQFRTSAFLSSLRDLTSQTDRRFVECMEAVGPIQNAVCDTFGDDHSRCFLFSAALDVLSAQTSQLGSRLPCVEIPSGNLAYIQLVPDGFPPQSRPEEYWKRIPPGPIVGWNGVVAGTDFPLDATLRTADYPRALDHVVASAAADSLLEEAVSQKHWTIPPGAVVPLQAGSFVEFQLRERDHDVAILCRNREREFLLCTLEPDTKWFDLAGVPSATEDEAHQQITAGLKLLMAALVRDFWIMEQREKVFTERVRPFRKTSPSPATGPRVVYLPRIRYTQTAHVSRCMAELGHESRTAHFVAPHFRKAVHASPHQLVIASRYGFTVPTGFTFVRPHERGAGQRDTVYRSRSALSCLFAEIDLGDAAPMADGWFEFERRVETWLTSQGFTIHHKRPTPRGDGGVDIFATKGEGLSEVAWVVQCKRYQRDKALGPSVVRELIGSLQAYPRGVRGFIVATCHFSSGARQLASEAGIKLMDRAELGVTF